MINEIFILRKKKRNVVKAYFETQNRFFLFTSCSDIWYLNGVRTNIKYLKFLFIIMDSWFKPFIFILLNNVISNKSFWFKVCIWYICFLLGFRKTNKYFFYNCLGDKFDFQQNFKKLFFFYFACGKTFLKRYFYEHCFHVIFNLNKLLHFH